MDEVQNRSRATRLPHGASFTNHQLGTTSNADSTETSNDFQSILEDVGRPQSSYHLMHGDSYRHYMYGRLIASFVCVREVQWWLNLPYRVTHRARRRLDD
jgi:hypothetical protein